ncbi:hypothetical protein C7C46_23840 [Streptomyces tateyamensis]|uniref:Uncharacterized protein n=1 Tax=Streptomyces tateyamensis TaxID=565073 RepID=A0A2V4NKL6_9ACTN|nr:hypothetical protein [Streptomyces tateyamensis]PYC74557.1 hypothetical protein C7C46_23840 [Streptomyces tateyamensis]
MVGELSKKIDDVQGGWARGLLPDGCHWQNVDRSMSAVFAKYFIHDETSFSKASMKYWEGQDTKK